LNRKYSRVSFINLVLEKDSKVKQYAVVLAQSKILKSIRVQLGRKSGHIVLYKVLGNAAYKS
jgi:hypothetical protein